MGLFGEVKCGRCDRRYSAIRSRCPYCGARKKRGGKDSNYRGGKGSLIVGIVLVVIIILAVAYLLYNNLSGGAPKTSPTPSMSATGTPKPSASPSANPNATPSSTIPAVTPTPAVKVTSIVLNRQDFTLAGTGDTWVLTATVSPANASQSVTWTSQDTKVATVGTDGRVTGVGAGATTITATAGGVTATCIVRVNSGTVSAPSSPASTTAGNTSGISLSSTDVTLNASTRESFKLSVSGTSSASTFSSGNTGVATVDSSGTVTAVAEGTTSIYVTVGNTKLECIVRVIKR